MKNELNLTTKNQPIFLVNHKQNKQVTYKNEKHKESTTPFSILAF